MVGHWKQACYVMMGLNAVLMLASLTVGIVWFAQPISTARDGASSLPPPSPAESNVRKLTRETLQLAVEERQNNYHDAERFRNMTLLDSKKPQALLVLKTSQTFIRDQTLLWDINHNESNLKGFEYDERGYLRVSADGFYFVHAHLHYIEKPGNGFDRDRLKDYIFKTEKRFVDNPALRERMKRKLLFNEQTPCKVVRSEKPRATSHHGAVVYLNGDDMLSVASCFPENGISNAKKSHFGLLLV